MWLISFKDSSDKRYYYMIETINLCVCYLRMGNTGKNQPISSLLSVIRQYIIYVYYRKIDTLFARTLETSRKASLWRVICPVPHPVQISTYILRTLCLS